jgi:hypothetical protein
MTFPVQVKDRWINREQIPISPAFALTEYKVQGSTYQEAVLDLSWRSTPHGQDAMHKRYCSVNVQLSRLRTLIGVRLIEPVTFNDLDNKMHPELANEDLRLASLAAETMKGILL